jgi:multiple sugar transport system substrate-binding protein
MGHASQAPIEIRVGGGWSSADQGPAFVAAVEGFNKTQSAIHVTAIKGVSNSNVLTELPAGKAPDLFIDFTSTDVGQWANAGYILNLDPLIQQNHFNMRQIIPAARYMSTFNGHTYAIPEFVDTEMLLYNKTLFSQAGISKPPTTAEELMADAIKLTKKDAAGHITQLGFSPTLFASDSYGTWLPMYTAMFGGRLASADGKKITANCAQCVAALQWEANLYKAQGGTEVDRFLSGAGAAEYSASNVFFTGKVAMIVDGEYYTQMVNFYKAKNLSWDVAPMPYPAGHPELANSGADYGNPTMIMKSTKNPDAAFKVLAYLQSVDSAVKFASLIRNVPQMYAALQSPKLASDPLYRRFIAYAQGPKMTAFPVLPVSANYLTDLIRYEDLAIHGKMSAQAALNKVTSDTQTQLDAAQNGL